MYIRGLLTLFQGWNELKLECVTYGVSGALLSELIANKVIVKCNQRKLLAPMLFMWKSYNNFEIMLCIRFTFNLIGCKYLDFTSKSFD